MNFFLFFNISVLAFNSNYLHSHLLKVGGEKAYLSKNLKCSLSLPAYQLFKCCDGCIHVN